VQSRADAVALVSCPRQAETSLSTFGPFRAFRKPTLLPLAGWAVHVLALKPAAPAAAAPDCGVLGCLPIEFRLLKPQFPEPLSVSQGFVGLVGPVAGARPLAQRRSVWQLQYVPSHAL